VQAWIRAENFKLETKSAEVAGAVVAKSVADAQELANEKMTEHAVFFRRMSQMKTQHATTMARICGAPRWNHVQRCSLPSHIANATAAFNLMKRDALGKVLNEPSDADTWAQRELPKYHGGQGFRNLPAISELAYLASRAITASKRVSLNVTSSTQAHEQLQGTVRKVWLALQNAPRHQHLSLRAQIPQVGEDFDKHFSDNPSLADKLQAKLTSLLVDEPAHRAIEAKSPEHKIRLKTASSPHATDWMSAPQADPLNHMTNEESQIAYKLLAGAPPLSKMPATCGPCQVSIGPNGSHQLSCKRTAQQAIVKRHDRLAKIIHSAINSLDNASSVLELSGLCKHDRRRVEIEAHVGSSKTKLIDVQVINELTPSRMLLPDTATAIATAEAAKIKKYADVAAEQDAEVIPFIMTALGQFGPRALKFVEQLSEHAVTVGRNPVQFQQELLTRLSVSNAKSASHILRTSVSIQLHFERSRAQ
jgi:hypothetical protein